MKTMWRVGLGAVALAVASWTSPVFASDDDDDDMADDGSDSVGPTRDRGKPVWIAGVTMFSVTYAATIGITAAVAEEDKGGTTAKAAIPLVGPWIITGTEETTPAQAGALVLSGIVQSGSLVMIIAGGALSTRFNADSVALTPWAAPGTAGLTLSGPIDL